MKRPWNGWQIIGSLLAVVVPFTIFCVGLARTQSEQGAEIRNIKNDQYENKLNIDRRFDKIDLKQDKNSEKLEEVRVLLENKVNR